MDALHGSADAEQARPGAPVIGHRARTYHDFFADRARPAFWGPITEREIGDEVPATASDRWWVRLPCGHVAQLSPEHHVEDHGEAISVLPQPDNTNSILCSCGWHGYIREGVFEGQ